MDADRVFAETWGSFPLTAGERDRLRVKLARRRRENARRERGDALLLATVHPRMRRVK